MSGSSVFKSSFDNRKKKHNPESTDLPSNNTFGAIPNSPVNEEQSLSTSEPASFESRRSSGSDSEVPNGHMNGKDTERSLGSSSKSNSHELKTPTGSEQQDDNFEKSDFEADDIESIENPAELLLHGYGEGIDDIYDSVENLGLIDSIDIPEFSEYDVDEYKSSEISPYDSVFMHSDEQKNLVEDLPFGKRFPPRSQDPLLFLMSQEKVIKSQLQGNVKAHAEVSKKGLSSKSIRLNIEKYLQTLAQVYQSIIELYQKEFKRKTIMLKHFEKWEKNKQLLNDKVKDIRSESNKEGYRLSQLLKESSLVDEEIESLEKRLKQLKEKKKVLGNEVAQSQSIIESRTSSYLESLRGIEKVERTAIIKLSQERSTESGLSNSSLGFPIGRSSVKQYQKFGLQSLFKNFSSHLDSAYEIGAAPVVEMLERQIGSFKDCIDDFQLKEESFKEAFIIWEDISALLNELEITISDILKQQATSTNEGARDQTKSKIVESLTQTQNLLFERLDSITNMNETLKDLILTEISTLDMGIQMIAPEHKTRALPLEKIGAKDIQRPISQAATNPTVARFSISDKALASSAPHTTLAVGSGSLSSSETLQSKLKNGLFKKDSTTDSKQTKRD